ncbi:hypothetical protein [Bacteroides fragilis]|uniref:hypothetical protein n=1 Tax=Bacteroides fragilis TaxID=817 RepID=UPI00189DA887|nr:hypothetical protein [Bacteroides fragilis]
MEFKQLIDAYRQRVDAYYKEIEKICASHTNGQKKKIPPSPNYLIEVIIPVLCSLAKNMPDYKIKVPDPKTYFPIKGYYRIKVGITTVGGFAVPGKDDFSLYFVPMRHARPSSERYLVKNSENLVQLILNQLKAE